MAESTTPNSQKPAVPVKIKSKKILSKFLLAYMRGSVPRTILRKLGEAKTQTEIVDDLSLELKESLNGQQFTKQRLNYWVQKFLKDKLIYEYSSGTPIIYELTAFGKKVLTTSERGVKEPLLMESLDKKFRLLQVNPPRCSTCREVDCVKPKEGESNGCVVTWKKVGDPKNWQKWGFHYCGIMVERNDGIFPTVTIRSGELSGFSPYELVSEAGELIALVKAKLKDMGIVLDDVGSLLHEPIFHTYTQEAEILNAQGTVYGPDGWVDNSPLHNPVELNQRIPHEERNFGQQLNYMGMPSTVLKIAKDVHELQSQNYNMQYQSDERLSILEKKIDAFKQQADSLQQQNLDLKKENSDKDAKIDRLITANEKLTDAVGPIFEALSQVLPKKPESPDIKSPVKNLDVPCYVS